MCGDLHANIQNAGSFLFSLGPARVVCDCGTFELYVAHFCIGVLQHILEIGGRDIYHRFVLSEKVSW